MIAFKTIVILFPLLLCSTPGYSGGADTLKSEKSPVISEPASAVLSDDQLLSLIDSILDTDQPDTSFLHELNQLLVIRLTPVPQRHPCDDYYPGWDLKNIFRYDESIWKNDSTILLVLGKEYTHPVNGPVASRFGWRDSAFHKGIDIDLNTGDPVRACFDGVVRIARKESSYGKVVVIRHFNGLETLYAHLHRIKVLPNDTIKAGHIIGLGGNTGRSLGSHLHLETRFKGFPLNPAHFISFKDQQLVSDSMVLKKIRYGYASYPHGAEFHTVVRGDNLYDIARRYGLTLDKLCQLNGFKKKTILRVGQQVRII